MSLKISKFVFLFLACSFSLSSIGQVNYYLDIDGSLMSEKGFQKKWREQDGNYRWDYMSQDSGRVASLYAQQYQAYQIKHDSFVNYFEKLTGKTFSKEKNFLLVYKYLDDKCNDYNSNNLESWRITQKRDYYKEIIDVIDNDNIVLLVFFEKGIVLSNEKFKNKFFFTDKEGFLRRNIFKNPAMCGSWALIKPNGNALVQNGEHYLPSAVKFLKPEYWSRIFQE
jgi:hypothetical protein